VPVFFVRMGMLVHVGSFVKPGVFSFAVLITVAAMLGKWACALVTPRGVSRTTVGLGMMPRGEVGLIFAVFMVVVTTMVTPPLLLWSLKREGPTRETREGPIDPRARPA